MLFEVEEFFKGEFVTIYQYDTYREALEKYMEAVQEIMYKRIGCVRLVMDEETEYGECYSVIHHFLYKDKLDHALRS